jgi:hypothetical protein
MRADLQVATTIGAEGDAVLEAIEGDQQAFGEAFLTEALDALGVEQAAAGGVQLASFSRGSNLFEVQVGELGKGASTITANIALMTGALGQADKGVDLPGYKKEETYTSTEGSVVESTKINSTLTVKGAGGKLAVDIDQSSSSTVKRDDNLVGLLNGTGTGHLDISGCPDDQGNITGKIEITISELWSAGGKTGTTDRKVTGTFTIHASDTATLQSVAVHNVTSGGGTNGAGATWTAGGTSGFGTGEVATTTSSGATPAQVSETTGMAALVLFILVNAAGEAEKYWQSGKCVELTSSRESGEVEPEEQIDLQIDAISKVGAGQIKGNITATFSGKESLDPTMPQPAPATFHFKAGKDDGDKGTIQLEQKSKRGIGRKTLEFKVGGGYTFTASGKTNPFGFTLNLSIPTTKLVKSGDVYTATAPVTVTGKFAAESCVTKSVNFTATAKITVGIDPKKPEVAIVGVAPDASFATRMITTTCSKYPAVFSSGAAAITWFGIFVGSSSMASVTIGTATNLSATKASGTVTIAKAKATP